MRTHNHAVGESGNFWTLNLSLSNYVNPSYSDLKELWEETLEDSSVKFRWFTVLYHCTNSKNTKIRKGCGCQTGIYT